MSSQSDVRLPPEFNDLDVGITLHDADTGEILDVNNRLERLYGYTAETLRTMSVGEYTAPSTRFSQTEATNRIQSAADGTEEVFEWQIERSNGELRWVRVHLNSTTVVETPCVIAEVHDISEYKIREQRLRLLSRIVRHNLRNDMTVLMGYAERLKTAVEDETLADTAETVLDIAREVGTLSESITQLEQIAEPSATERSQTNLSDIGQSLIEEAEAEYSGVDLTLDTPGDVWVIADRGAHYAVSHAIENAIKHNDQDTPTVTVTVADDTASGRGVIRIADDGPTIPDVETEVLNQDVETSSTYHGSGVGLWVMQWCVNSLGGELVFTKNAPRGNVVSISFPRTHPPET